ncbi:MAG TPA: flagellar basal body P-ring protein FlgI [Vicinamibacterales bacterium]|jgi:flagellar P-ring protein precursor FlgI
MCPTRTCAVLLTVALFLPGAGVFAQGHAPVRLKDVARLDGYQAVPLVGYGLVVGLNKTGDRRQTIFSAQSLANMLQRFGIVVPGDQMKIENVAAVMVTAELPAFVRAGARIDITASSVGDARSLQGGMLLPTPLRGPDGSVYALGQGALTLGGFGGGKGGNSVQVNHLTAGRVPAGGMVQYAQRVELKPAERIILSVNDPDYTTAMRLAKSISAELGSGAAQVVDPASVAVKVPEQYRASLPDLMARLEPLSLEVDAPARVVINERTGTVVVGSDVRIGSAAVAHGNLSVKISTKYNVSQPSPFSKQGDTVVTPDENVDVSEGGGQLVALEEGTTLQSVIKALNALGATPRDIIAIMQALKAAGALRAELVII